VDVLILAGGKARRLPGADKPLVDIGGRTLLDRVIEACIDSTAGGDSSLVVVGPLRSTALEVRWTREQPPGGGPAAAIAAGLAVGANPWVGVFAADLPFLTPALVHSLWTSAVSASPQVDGAVAIDSTNREQWLAGVYRRDALLAALDQADEVSGLPLRRLLRDFQLIRVKQSDVAVLDCDTWDDVATARDLANRARPPGAHRR
jgi:molybdopterin-guanine dinucleotide biosynthesis protein A